MAAYIGPVLWLAAALFAAFCWHRISGPEFLGHRSPEQLKNLRSGFNSRVHIVLTGAVGLWCLLNTVGAIWRGHDTWWLWLLATGAQVGLLLTRERAAARFFHYLGEERGPRTARAVRRQRHVLGFATVAVVAFILAQVVMPNPDVTVDGSPRVLIAMVCLAVAALAALGAGWSAVWVFPNGSDRHRGPQSPTSG